MDSVDGEPWKQSAKKAYIWATENPPLGTVRYLHYNAGGVAGYFPFSQIEELAERLFGDAHEHPGIPRQNPELVKIARDSVTRIKSPYYYVYKDAEGFEYIIEKGGEHLTKIDGEDYYVYEKEYDDIFCFKASEIEWIDARSQSGMIKAKR